jgi:hypothetical protein
VTETQVHEVKMPVHIRAYLASVSNWLLRRDRSPPDRARSDSAECVSFDVSETLPPASNPSHRSDEIFVAPLAMGFALPGHTNGAFNNGPFSETTSEVVDLNNNAAAWMGLGVALSAFALVFGGYVAIAGMGNPAMRRAEAFVPRVMGMAWLPGDIAALPEASASATLAATSAERASEATVLTDTDRQLAPQAKQQSTADATPARQRTRSTQPAARREPAMRTADVCTGTNQHGCARKYATKGPAIDPFSAAARNPRRVQRDFDQPMQWNSESAATIAPSRTSNVYQHH